MQINREGLELIKRFEGLRLNAYQDVAGIWTIGYGHTGSDVKPGLRITEAEAETLLLEDLKSAERGVADPLHVKLNDNEFSALVSLVFNIGRSAFSRSTVVKLLNKDDRIGAADAIELWNKATVGGNKVVVPGLVSRRAAEKGLFLTPTVGEILTSVLIPEKAPASPSKAAPATKPADAGPESRVTPIESSRTRRDGLGGSRTIGGAATTAATGAATAGTGAAKTQQQANPYVQQVIDFINQHSNEILIAIGIIIVIASLWIIFARLDDWVHNRR